MWETIVVSEHGWFNSLSIWLSGFFFETLQINEVNGSWKIFSPVFFEEFPSKSGCIRKSISCKTKYISIAQQKWSVNEGFPSSHLFRPPLSALVIPSISNPRSSSQGLKNTRCLPFYFHGFPIPRRSHTVEFLKDLPVDISLSKHSSLLRSERSRRLCKNKSTNHALISSIYPLSVRSWGWTLLDGFKG